MNKTSTLLTAVLVSSLAIASVSQAKPRETGRGNPDGPVIFVTSQGLYFDSIVLTDLPQRGPFQQLVPTEMGLTTEFGPGQPGHRGGRWWLDSNMNEVMDDEDMFFLCPLLGPGRATP